MHRIATVLLIIFCLSCSSEKVYIPKPRIYPRVDFPPKEYKYFKEAYCDFEFKIPAYSEVVQDSLFFGEKTVHPCWFDLQIPALNGTLHCNYVTIANREGFDKLIYDAYTMAGKHNIKAAYYKETKISYPNNVNGIMFEIEGDVATPVQFFLTDSMNHFFRASLYFNNRINIDSMAPIYSFVKTDIDTIIETFRWK